MYKSCCLMADFTSRAGKRRKEKAHHPLEPVADKLYSHLHTSAQHILVLWLLHPPQHASPSSVWQSSAPILCRTLWVCGGRDEEPREWWEAAQPVGHIVKAGAL